MKHLNSPQRVRSLLSMMMTSLGLVLLIELLNRRSISGLFEFLMSYPLVFFYNACLVALSFTLVFFTRRLKYTFYLVTGVWTSLAVINMVIRSFRMTPFTLDDTQFITNIPTIMPLYLSSTQILLVISASVMLILTLAVMFFKSTKQKRLFKYGFIHLGVIGGLVFTLPNLSSSIARFEETDGNLKNTYDEFGFAYSFVQSVISKGVKRPSDFDEELLLKRLNEMKFDSSKAEDVNFIAIQLESFFDVNRIGLNLTSNPIPFFSSLKDQYTSGVLSVPTIGGGTANSEFEFLTSMDLSYFGTGEYPYKTVLREQSLPSLVSYFNGLNYTTTALHNHVANFYRRQVVYQYLGFNTFVSSETMQDLTTTPMGWAKDKHLIPYIQQAMLSSSSKDFIFGVSVQGHGEYPHDPLDPSMIEYITPTDEHSFNNINYYLNQINEMDQMIESLVTWVKSSEEPILLVLYGDHLPGIDFGLDSIQTYLSDYVILSNFEMEVSDEDLDLPQLGAKALSMIHHPGTTIHTLQQIDSTNKNLMAWIHYDWVMGNQVSMDDLNLPSYFQLGLTQPRILEIQSTSEYIILNGEHFLPSHVVIVDGERRQTTYISSNLIVFEGNEEIDKKIEFGIVSDNNEVLPLRTQAR